MTLKEQILAAQDVKFIPVEVPEWGCTVYVRTETVGDALESLQAAQDSGRDPAIVNCERWILDEEGNRVFADGEGTALLSKSIAALRRITDAHHRLNGGLAAAPDSPKN